MTPAEEQELYLGGIAVLETGIFVMLYVIVCLGISGILMTTDGEGEVVAQEMHLLVTLGVCLVAAGLVVLNRWKN